VIKELSDLPAGVVGFEATGTLRAEDYRDVVIPALEHASASGEVRFVVVIPEFHGMSGGALWQDLKMGLEHFRAWKRIALVTDIEWMNVMTSLFGWMTPGDVRHFPLAQRDEAIAWAAALRTRLARGSGLVREDRVHGHSAKAPCVGLVTRRMTVKRYERDSGRYQERKDRKGP
jgi:hypothetical protein